MWWRSDGPSDWCLRLLYRHHRWADCCNSGSDDHRQIDIFDHCIARIGDRIDASTAELCKKITLCRKVTLCRKITLCKYSHLLRKCRKITLCRKKTLCRKIIKHKNNIMQKTLHNASTVTYYIVQKYNTMQKNN